MTAADDVPGLTEHAAHNRASWDASSDEYQALHGDQLAESGGLAWGTTQIPESELRVLGDVAGLGHPRVRLWRGAVVDRPRQARCPSGRARPLGATARACTSAHEPRPASRSRWSTGAARPSLSRTPRSTSSSATTARCRSRDPYRTVPEAARLLRPGGLFAFNHEAPLASICWPRRRRPPQPDAGSRLLRAPPARGRPDQLPAATRRVDPALPVERLRHRGPDRVAAGGRCRQHVPGRRGSRMVAALAGRGDLAAATRLRAERQDRFATLGRRGLAVKAPSLSGESPEAGSRR